MGGEPEESVGLRMSKPFGTKLVELAEISEDDFVLDIGTGLGPVFFSALTRVGKHGHVVGIDISDEMVKGTRAGLKRCRLRNAAIIESDARSLVFRDSTFDVVLSGFSYIYSSLKEVLRVLRKGGLFGLSTWSALGDMDCMAEFAERYMPISVEDVYHRDTPEALKKLLLKAGFEEVRVFVETQEFVFKDEEQWWEEVVDSGWQTHLAKIEDLGFSLVEFKQEIFKGLQKYKRTDGVPFTISAILALAIKSRSA